MSELIDLAEWCEQLREANAYNECISFFSKGDDCRHVDYFITAHLSKSKQQVAEYHIKHFRNVLDRKTCGRGRRLYKAVFVEEGKNALSVSYNQRHCHLLIQKPKHLTKAQFQKQFNQLWADICGSEDIKWKRITAKDGGVGGLISYCNKEIKSGIKAFRKELSDNSYQQRKRQN